MSGNKNFLFTDTTKDLVLGTHKVFNQIIQDTEKKIKTDQQKTDLELRARAIFELEQDPNSGYNKYRQELLANLPGLQETLKSRQADLSKAPEHQKTSINAQIKTIQNKIEDIIAQPEQQINDYIAQIKNRTLIDVLYHNTRTAPESSSIKSKYNMPVNAFAVSRIQKLHKITKKLKTTGIPKEAIDDFVKNILQQDFNKQALTNINTTHQTYAKNLEEFFDAVNKLEADAIKIALNTLQTKYPENISQSLITNTTQFLTIENKADILGKLTQQLAESEANLISLSRNLQQQQTQNTKIIIDLRIQHELLTKQLTDAKGDAQSKEQKITTINSKLADIQIKLTAAEKENNELQEQEQKNKQSITDLQTQLTSLQTDLSKKSQEIDNYKTTIAANDKSIAQLQLDLKNSTENQEQTQKKLAEQLGKNASLTTELHKKQTSLFNEQQAHVTTNSLLTTTKQQLESTSSELEKAKENLLKIQKERQDQDAQTKKITAELEQAAKKQINDLQEQQATLSKRANELETANANLQKQLTEAQKETTRLNKELNINQDKLAKTLNKNKTLKLEKQKLITQLNQAKQSDSENTIKLKQELATINDQLEQNTKEITTLRKETARLTKENADLNIENATLKSANQELSELLKGAKQQQADLANKIVEQDTTIQAKEEKIKGINIIITNQQNKITELTNKNQEALSEITRLKSSGALDTSKITELQNTIEQNNNDIATATTSINQLTSDLTAAKQTIANQEEIIQKLTTNITNSEASLAEKQAFIDKLQTSAAEQENKYKLAKAQIETYESLIEQKIQDFTKTENDLKSSLTETKQKLSATNNQLKKANQDKKDLTEQLSTAKKEAFELNQQTSKQIQDLNKQLAVKQLENDNLTKQLETNQKEIEELEHKTAEQEQEITKNKELIKKLRKELQENAGSKKQAIDLFKLKKEQDLTIKQLEEANENLLQALKFNKRAIHTKNVLINSLKQQLNKLQLELTQKDHEISELTRELNSFKDKYEEANDSIKQLQQQLEQETLARQQLEQELLASTTDQAILKKQQELAEKNQKIDDLTNELATTYEKLTKALSDLDEAREEINRLNQELLETKQENAKLKEELAAAHKREEIAQQALLQQQQEIDRLKQPVIKQPVVATTNTTQIENNTQVIAHVTKEKRIEDLINQMGLDDSQKEIILQCLQSINKVNIARIKHIMRTLPDNASTENKEAFNNLEQKIKLIIDQYYEKLTSGSISTHAANKLTLQPRPEYLTTFGTTKQSASEIQPKAVINNGVLNKVEKATIKFQIKSLNGNDDQLSTILNCLESMNKVNIARIKHTMKQLEDNNNQTYHNLNQTIQQKINEYLHNLTNTNKAQQSSTTPYNSNKKNFSN